MTNVVSKVSNYQIELFKEIDASTIKLLTHAKKWIKRTGGYNIFEELSLKLDQDVIRYKKVLLGETVTPMILSNFSNFDLSEYQIYKENDTRNDMYSLYYAATKCGIDPTLLPYTTLSVEDFAIHIKHTIILYQFDKNGKPIGCPYNNIDTKLSVIKIALYKKHYFVYKLAGCMYDIDTKYKKARRLTSLNFICQMFKTSHIKKISASTSKILVRPPLSICEYSGKDMKYNKIYLNRVENISNQIKLLENKHPKLACRLAQDVIPYIDDEKYVTVSIKDNIIDTVKDNKIDTSPDEIFSLLRGATYDGSVFSLITDKVVKPCCFIKEEDTNKYSKRYKSELSMRNEHIKKMAKDYKSFKTPSKYVKQILDLLENPLNPISEDDLKYQECLMLKYDNGWTISNKILPSDKCNSDIRDIRQEIYNIVQVEIIEIYHAEEKEKTILKKSLNV
jgi:hypothetical protein